jgi:hypothetical protein
MTTNTTETDVRYPALPCPPWCIVRHEGQFTSHQARRDFGVKALEGYVTLYLSDYGAGNEVLAPCNGQIAIHVTWHATGKTVVWELGHAEEFAETAEAFGRKDVAALIRELAAIGQGAA